MKHVILFLLPVMIIIGSIFFMTHEQYVGNVVGKLEVSKPYRYGTQGPYKYIDISFEYKDKNGKMHIAELTGEDKYFLENTIKGKRLKRGEVYLVPERMKLIGIFCIIGSAAFLITLFVHLCCFHDSGYHYNMSKENMGCYKCCLRNFCYFANTKFNIPTEPIKNFFGY